jgi:hypothetical protein
MELLQVFQDSDFAKNRQQTSEWTLTTVAPGQLLYRATSETSALTINEVPTTKGTKLTTDQKQNDKHRQSNESVVYIQSIGAYS